MMLPVTMSMSLLGFQPSLPSCLPSFLPSKTGVLSPLPFFFLQPLYTYAWLWLPQLLWISWHFSIHFLSSRVRFQSYFPFHWKHLWAYIFVMLFVLTNCLFLKLSPQTQWENWEASTLFSVNEDRNTDAFAVLNLLEPDNGHSSSFDFVDLAPHLHFSRIFQLTL